ncbi:DUF5655 domain-containing protein [Capnocytophaga gingivalis]|jgi:uncharacterized protein HI_1375|uniref:DUF5655 domain-containing protein n=1 Tax=Capnocytophaga gingivalis TaxID=1017 RepID=UPI002354FA69|nr:DUF5655 domain-containing protein [Capnocytophaga gingivalis]
MQLFQNNKSSLMDLREISFKLERDIQQLFEKNLFQITGLEFVKSEFSIQNQRIDTLAFDMENNAFVIIEYKRGHNYSVFDQGVAYLNTLLKYKADFVLEYNEALNKTLKKNEVDWSQSKIVFVSPSFNQNQKQAVDFKDLNIELWEIKQFENNIIVIDGVQKSQAAPSIKLTSISEKKTELSEIAKEIKTYNEEDFYIGKTEEIIELYNDFKQAILNLSSEISILPKKVYIAFKKDRKNIADIQILNKGLKIFINVKKGDLEDPKGITKDISRLGHHGNGDYQVEVSDTKYLEYVMSLIKQGI